MCRAPEGEPPESVRALLNMRISAYVLLADPTWITTSVSAYYPYVDRIVASYDRSGRGWTGSPVRTEECIRRLRAMDVDEKVQFLPGDYCRVAPTPMQGETIQRQAALDAASIGSEWVLQLDTDEVLPRFEALEDYIAIAQQEDLPAVEWPMRVLYRALGGGRYLQVMDDETHVHFEYPGPIVVRAGTALHHARRTRGEFLRPVVVGHDRSMQVVRGEEEGETRRSGVDVNDAIWHNSWARPVRQTARKIASWGHSSGLRSWAYFGSRWLPAAATWRNRDDWHPFVPGLWPKLSELPRLPFPIIEEG